MVLFVAWYAPLLLLILAKLFFNWELSFWPWTGTFIFYITLGFVFFSDDRDFWMKKNNFFYPPLYFIIIILIYFFILT